MAGGEMLSSIFNQNEYSTAAMRAVWTDESRLRCICRCETALAQAMASQQLIPAAAAQEIAQVLQPKTFNLRKLRLSVARRGHYLAGLMAYVQPRFQNGGEQYLHQGAASEDIEDTAYVLQLQAAHPILIRYLEIVIKRLAQLTRRYQSSLTACVTHRIYGSYTTLGFKLGIFLNEYEHLLTALEKQTQQTFCGSLANADGLSQMIGPQYQAVEAKFCELLGLGVPEMYWHTQRERFVDYTHLVTEIAQVGGRLGQELLYMSQTLVREFQEPYAPERQGSTVIPTSRCPYLCESVVNLSKVIRNEMTLMYEQMQVHGDKDTTVWRNLYVALPEIMMYLSGQLNYLGTLLNKGQFNLEQMRANLDRDDGTMYSGAIMNALTPHVGRRQAHAYLYQARLTAEAQGISLRTSILQSPEITQVLSAEQLTDIMTPQVERIPNAVTKVDQILQLFQEHHQQLFQEVFN
ncbi:3-carboxy-cis,cis-muconate cycloisomerase [Lactobacillus sp. DCY120]|uniref:3-carboxy-cis,cis-muconate cycloisomerase n=1 Tax=Bombilactobacillus apium TaxID=2675299 RepID=A0A850RAQ3_9LACO|nr:lyase family protein [Bombilactobacillus apium]NVY96416.1 3-carboxy-cis,cis-muconate cycloisomerase [Bombilactobacillus apium]